MFIGFRSTGTFKLSYTDKHASLFLDQIHSVMTGGFVPNVTGADPDFGKCLQCAAIDRSRFKTGLGVARSQTCSQCFKQYCFDPANPPSAMEIVGRKLAFVDPDPQGIAKVEGFLSRGKIGLIAGLVVLFAVIFAAVVIAYVRHSFCKSFIDCALVLRVRMREHKHRAYKKVLDHDIWPLTEVPEISPDFKKSMQ